MISIRILQLACRVVVLFLCYAPSYLPAASPHSAALIGNLFSEDLLATNTRAVHQRAMSLPPHARFALLRAFVLPNESGPPRLDGVLQSTLFTTEQEDRTDQLVCPAVELLEAAVRDGRLDELETSVQNQDPTLQRTVFLLLLALRRNNPEAAQDHLTALVETFQQNRSLTERTAWCFLLAGREASASQQLRPAVEELFREIDASCFGNNAPNVRLRLRNQLVSFARQSTSSAPWSGTVAVNWLPVTLWTSRTNPNVAPASRWVYDDNGLHDRSGSPHHYLFYRIPLRGNFQISGITTDLNLRDIAIVYSGQYLLPKYKALRVGSLSLESRQVAEPIRMDKSVRILINVQDGRCRTFFNGHMVQERQLSDEHNPWLAIRSGTNLPGSLTHLQISGDVNVPKTVNMMPSEDMTGWLPFFAEKIGTQAKWSTWKIVKSGNERHLSGPRRPPLQGTHAESLLSYGRPVAEDGVIQYEFRYIPDQLHVHPAIGTTAFLFEPDGVKIHHVTNGRHETAEVSPEACELVANANPLPLKTNAWNAVRMTFDNDQLNVALNGTPIYSTTLPHAQHRTFGLFRYLDRTAVRIRNLKWTGKWPSAVPDTSEQQFAVGTVPQLNAERDALLDVFEHDFTTAGMPERFFTPGGVRQHYETHVDNGLVLSTQSRGDWAAGDIFSTFNVHGDFDITAAYDNVQFDAPGESGARLILHPQGEHDYDLRIGRVRGENGEQDIKAMASYTPRGGRIPKGVFHLPTEATAGRLRIARRGNVYHYLFAEGDSTTFFHAGQEVGPTGPLNTNGLHLSSMCLGRGTFSVRWKNVRIAASRLQLRVPDGVTGPQALYVMSAPDLTAQDEDTPLWRKYCQQRVNQFELTVENTSEQVSRSAAPVMVHHQRAFSDGLIYLWTQTNGRPVAIGTVLLEDRNAEGGFREVNEFHSLHDGPLTMTDKGSETWNVAEAGITWKEISEAPVPATTQNELFEQAAALSTRFSAELRRRGTPGPPLLDEPVYRYSLTENGRLIAGILTAFSNDANPEVLLSLEVRRNRANQYRWHCAGANYTGMNGYLLLDGKQIWQEAPARFGKQSPHRGWFPHENLKPEEGIAATDSAVVRKITDLPPEFTDMGSPRWSPDRKKILFDMRNQQREGHIAIVAAAEATPAQMAGRGLMPAMSPDGRQIVFSEPGIMRMNSDGTNREQITSEGWAVDWSPDGKHIAWGRGNQIVVMNVTTQATRNLLTAPQAAGIRQLFWNHRWSPDSRSIVFKAVTTDGSTMIAMAQPDKPESFKIVYVGNTGEKITWHPNGEHICFCMTSPQTGRSQLYLLNVKTAGPPVRLPGQPVGWNAVDPDWSSDGSSIAFIGEPTATVLEWPLTTNSPDNN